ncbi:MAG TPA: membrane dipeptidase [Candidatus Limnocylindrales bacterium]|nr:membrane dipeptidase [Candidatus Limnocylindrales bacterium]
MAGGPSPWRRRLAISTLAAAGATVAAPIVRGAIGERLSARTERRLNRVTDAGGGGEVSAAARDLHERLTVVDLHADSLLWGRDLLVRADRGHVDVPRMVAGRLALQVFAATTQVPRHLNYDRNDDRSDDIRLVALAQGWPRATWTSRTARAEHLASRLRDAADRSEGHLSIVRSAANLDGFLERRSADASLVAGMLAIEGAHALDGDLANVERLDRAGYRMVGLAHFFDNAFAGSAHGVARGGLTPLGRDLVRELERRRILVDVAHASSATIDDVLAMSTRPVLASHTGVHGVAAHDRNLSDDQLRAIAATGGLIGIGFWPIAAGGEGVDWIARSIAHAVAIAGPDHVALGSDFDGAVSVPFDASELARLTAALLAAGLDEATIAAVMGGSAIRLLRTTLPPG